MQRILGLGCWDGFRNCSSETHEEEISMRWFQVKKCNKIMGKGKVACEMRVGSQKYCIVTIDHGKAAFRITNTEGQIVAEVINQLLIHSKLNYIC